MAPKRKLEMTERRPRPAVNSSSFSECPACKMKVVISLMNHHLDWDCASSIRSTDTLPISLAANGMEMLAKSSGWRCGKKPHHDGHDAEDFGAKEHKRSSSEDEGPKNGNLLRSPDMSLASARLLKEGESELRFESDVCQLDKGIQAEFRVSSNNCSIFGSNAGHQRNPGFCEGSISDKHENDFDVNEKNFGTYHEVPKPCNPCEWSNASTNRNSHCLKTTNASDLHTECRIGTEMGITCIEANKASPNLKHELCTHAHSPFEDSSERGHSNLEASTSSSKIVKLDSRPLFLKPLPLKAPRGHHIFENFISEQEEKDILLFLDTDFKNPWKLSTFNGLHLGKAYGLSTDLRKRVVGPAIFGMPNVLAPIIERMRTTVPVLKDFWPNDTNAIDYHKHNGHWLKAHVDDRQLSGTIVVNLSLCGDCRMTYIRERGPKESYKVVLHRRCIQILTGESRYSFTHSIHNEDLLDARRVSMTLRQSVNS